MGVKNPSLLVSCMCPYDERGDPHPINHFSFVFDNQF